MLQLFGDPDRIGVACADAPENLLFPVFIAWGGRSLPFMDTTPEKVS